MHGDDLRLEKLRAALRAYRAFTRGRSRSSLTWLELAGDIEAYTGVAMGAEVLRQFVEGVSRKDPARTRVPSDQNLQAIVAFLTHPDIDALSAKELEEDEFAWQACVRLSQFLRQDFDRESVRPPAGLEGTYRAAAAIEGGTAATWLRLRVRPEDGTILVPAVFPEGPAQWPQSLLGAGRRSRVVERGGTEAPDPAAPRLSPRIGR